MINKKVLGTIALAAISLSVAIPAFAEDNNKSGLNVDSSLNVGVRVGDQGDKNDNEQDGGRGSMMRGGIFGTVTTVNGNNMTISGKQGFGVNTTTSTTFTVDAPNA